MLAKARLAALAWSYRREILIAAVVVMIMPVLLLAAVAGAFLAVVPMVSDPLIPLYQRVARETRAPDGSEVEINWQSLVVLDAIRYGQDYGRVTEQSIRDLAALFVEEVREPGGQECEKGEPHCSCLPFTQICRILPHTWYRSSTSGEVAELLGFTEAQMQQLRWMAGVDLRLVASCLHFEPSPGAAHVWPVNGPVTSCFGLRDSPDGPGDEFHWGIDIAASEGTPILAASAGVIHFAGTAGNYGNLTILIGDDGLHTWYGHLSAFEVGKGARVEAGAVIGYVGNTGRSTGPHLHFETRPNGGEPVNPLLYYGG